MNQIHLVMKIKEKHTQFYEDKILSAITNTTKLWKKESAPSTPKEVSKGKSSFQKILNRWKKRFCLRIITDFP